MQNLIPNMQMRKIEGGTTKITVSRVLYTYQVVSTLPNLALDKGLDNEYRAHQGDGDADLVGDEFYHALAGVLLIVDGFMQGHIHPIGNSHCYQGTKYPDEPFYDQPLSFHQLTQILIVAECHQSDTRQAAEHYVRARQREGKNRHVHHYECRGHLIIY